MPNSLPIIYVFEDDLDGLERSGETRAPVFDTPKAGTVSFEHIGHCVTCKHWRRNAHGSLDCMSVRGPSKLPSNGSGFCCHFEATTSGTASK